MTSSPLMITSQGRRRLRFGAAVLAASMLTGLAAATPAAAKGGQDDRIVLRGSCSAAAEWKLKAKPDDGRLEIEWEVDSNRVGQRWSWRIAHDGTTLASGHRTTHAPSGSFSVERRIRDASGKHAITATARNARTGEVCRATVRI